MQLKKISISRDENIYEAFPDVAVSATGKLVCVFLECKHHSDRSYTRIMICESFDRGRTWTAKKPLTQATTSWDSWWNCPRIQTLQDGRMLVVVDRVHGRESCNQAEAVLFVSDTDAVTWSGPIETPCKGIVPDRLCETATGRWILSVHHRDSETENLAQRAWYSDDKGETWSSPVMVAGQKGLDLCEVSILQVEDTLVGLLRENSSLGLDCYKVISSDNGKTWSQPIEFPLPACHRPVAGILNDGRVMITYRFMQGGNGWLGKWTQNFFAAVTDQPSLLAKTRNEAWTRIRPVDFDRSGQSDTGYSGWVQFEDDEVFIVNYIVDDATKAHICGYALNPNDFFDPPVSHETTYESADHIGIGKV